MKFYNKNMESKLSKSQKKELKRLEKEKKIIKKNKEDD